MTHMMFFPNCNVSVAFPQAFDGALEFSNLMQTKLAAFVCGAGLQLVPSGSRFCGGTPLCLEWILAIALERRQRTGTLHPFSAVNDPYISSSHSLFGS